MLNQFWTDERVELLRRRWLEGMSASQIAKELGEGATRNAVIGKVHRLGIAGRTVPSAQDSEAEEALPLATAEIEPGEPAAPSRAEPARTEEAPVVPARTAAEAPVPRVDAAGTVVPIAKRLPLEKLTERTCKWPIGDPGHPDFHFCGHTSLDGLPYCRYHAGVAYQAADPRRRVGNRFASAG